MAVINWNESLSVKVESIDSQHKKLIDLINTFYEGISQGSNKEKLVEMILALKNYTVYHFGTEEKYMEKFGYPDYASHKKEHEQFVKKVLDFEERFKSGKMLLTLEVTGFIKDWISHHIMGTDKKYSDFFISKGIK